MLEFHQVQPFDPPRCDTAAWSDRMIYHTDEWIRFVADTQDATPVRAELRDGGAVLGYVFGLVFSRFGIRIFGSPFAGWTTLYMGFNLEPDLPRWMALEALGKFVFRDLGCLHFEIVDRHLSPDDGRRLGLTSCHVESYQTDLTQTEDAIFESMEGACRRCIRKAEKSGVTVEEAGEEGFAEEYYEQLKDVFAKQGLVPTYGVDRVRALIRHLHPTGRLLLLRARDPSGHGIATGIYPGMNHVAQFWGNASFRSGQQWRPNEALHWYAMRYWKRRGAGVFDWGGGGSYKEKYGCERILVPRFHQSRHRVLARLRDAAQSATYGRQRLLGWLHSLRSGA
jgi:GNAT acetyltransferase-like protein